MSEQELTHFDARGQAHMVDVGDKALTRRVAVASGRICMGALAFELLQSGSSKKGDVLGVARVAAIQAVKQMSLGNNSQKRQCRTKRRANRCGRERRLMTLGD